MTQKGFALIKSAMLFDVQKTLQIGWSVQTVDKALLLQGFAIVGTAFLI